MLDWRGRGPKRGAEGGFYIVACVKKVSCGFDLKTPQLELWFLLQESDGVPSVGAAQEVMGFEFLRRLFCELY